MFDRSMRPGGTLARLRHIVIMVGDMAARKQGPGADVSRRQFQESFQ